MGKQYWNIDTCDTRDKPWKRHTKWKKAVTKDWLCISPFIWNVQPGAALPFPPSRGRRQLPIPLLVGYYSQEEEGRSPAIPLQAEASSHLDSLAGVVSVRLWEVDLLPLPGDSRWCSDSPCKGSVGRSRGAGLSLHTHSGTVGLKEELQGTISCQQDPVGSKMEVALVWILYPSNFHY